MKKKSLLALDMLRKEELASLKGGTVGTNKVCGCICVGPVQPIEVETNLRDCEVSSSDGDCADCGASNAHRVSNSPTIQ